VTRAEKKAWDLGFEAHDAGRDRHNFPRTLTNRDIEAWLRGWDVARQEGRGPHAPVFKEKKR